MNWLKQQVANVAGTQEPIYGPSAIQSVAQQAETTPYTELQKSDLRWVAMESTCVETQVFYLMADSGHIGLAQVIYSNVAYTPKWDSDYMSIQYHDLLPGQQNPKVMELRPIDVDLSEDGTFYTIKSATNESSVVNLKVTRKTPGFQVGKDGKSLFGTDLKNPWGTMRHAFWPRCDVEGVIITKAGSMDFSGRAMFIHALQGMKPHHAAAKWNFANFQGPTYSAIMMEYTTPPSYGSTIVNVGGIAKDGEIICAGSSHSVTHVEIKDDPQNEWPEPSAVKFVWTGKTKDGKGVSAELAGSLGTRLDKVDVMAEVPGFVKTIIGNIAGTKPYIYQYSPKLNLKLNIGGEDYVEEGTTFSEAVFIT